MAVTIDGSANTITASAASATALSTASGSAPSYSARAWVNFNGTGTVAIRASGNVSSITDNGVGNYTANFTTALPDTNYAAIGNMNALNTGTGASNDGQASCYGFTTSSVSVFCMDGGGTAGDKSIVNIIIAR